jgi:hypothetical protein
MSNEDTDKEDGVGRLGVIGTMTVSAFLFLFNTVQMSYEDFHLFFNKHKLSHHKFSERTNSKIRINKHV